MYNYNEKVVWPEINETKLTPEDIEKQKHFYLECLRRAGHITYEEMWSHMWKSLDEIKEIVEIIKSDRAVWPEREQTSEDIALKEMFKNIEYYYFGAGPVVWNWEK